MMNSEKEIPAGELDGFPNHINLHVVSYLLIKKHVYKRKRIKILSNITTGSHIHKEKVGGRCCEHCSVSNAAVA